MPIFDSANTYPSKYWQSTLVGEARVGDRVSYYVPIPVGTVVRQRVGVGKHPAVIGLTTLGSIDKIRRLSIIYRHRPGIGQEKLPYYRPFNKQSPKQMNWRFIFAECIAAWKALSPAETAWWNERGKSRRTRGTYLFRREWMLSHKNVGAAATVGTTRIGGLAYIM